MLRGPGKGAPLAAGAVLRGRYRILELVGEGGGGTVFRAEDLRLTGRLTAVKQIRPESWLADSVREATVEQFRREASTLARLDHAALPKVSDYFSEGPVHYLVMDFVAGPDLRQMVEEARVEGAFLRTDMVLGWMKQLLDVLDYLHGCDPPVLHRDVKPSNIKLVDGKSIKLVDFGLVKPLDPADVRTLTVARGVGSLPYTPLEQYAGDTGHTGVTSDIYSIGATLYHLLTGRPPATAQERFLMPNALERPSRVNPDISARVEGAILAAMALHPQKRPASVSALDELLFGTGPIGVDPQVMTRPAALQQALWDNAGLFALAGLLFLMAVLATWQAMP